MYFMPTRDNQNKPENQDNEQNVFSGNEEKKKSPFKDDQVNSDPGSEGSSDEDVYRSRNLEIEKERD